jgi:hypothetical protein
MKKLTKPEIATIMYELTGDYTDMYMDAFKKPMDKQIWAALHIGFIAGMKVNGYSEKEVNQALDLCQKMIANNQP